MGFDIVIAELADLEFISTPTLVISLSLRWVDTYLIPTRTRLEVLVRQIELFNAEGTAELKKEVSHQNPRPQFPHPLEFKHTRTHRRRR